MARTWEDERAAVIAYLEREAKLRRYTEAGMLLLSVRDAIREGKHTTQDPEFPVSLDTEKLKD